jgi:hypothetical protein
MRWTNANGHINIHLPAVHAANDLSIQFVGATERTAGTDQPMRVINE